MSSGRLVIKIAALCVIVAGLHYASPFLVPIAFAAVLVTITSPIAAWVTRRGLPPVVGAGVAIIVDLAVLGGLGAVLGLAASEVQNQLPHYIARSHGAVAQWSQSLSRHGMSSMGKALTSVDASDAMPFLGSLAADAANALANGSVVILVVFFALCETSSIGAKVRSLMAHPDDVLSRLDRVVREVQRYLLVKFATSFVAAVFTFALLKVCGVNLALLLAVTLFVLHFIPNVGAVIATIPAVVIALFDRGAGIALAVGVGMSVIVFVIGNLLEPRILGRTLGLSPLAVLVGILFWGWLWGAGGALLAVPIMVVGKAILENTDNLGWLAKILEPAAPEVATGRPSLSLLHRARSPIGLGAGDEQKPGSPNAPVGATKTGGGGTPKPPATKTA